MSVRRESTVVTLMLRVRTWLEATAALVLTVLVETDSSVTVGAF